MAVQNKKLGTIAVDVIPILPGGENGGAKVFALELLRRLAEMAPQTQFVLLTQSASHEELAILDRPNMRRMMVVRPVPANSHPARWVNLASRIVRRLPPRLGAVASRFGNRVLAQRKHVGAGSLLRDQGVDLLYCPFTAPTYFEAGIPTVCTVYDLQYKTYPQFFTAEDVAHRDRTFLDACQRATALTAISDYSRDSAIAYGKLDPTRIRTIHLRMAQRIAPGTGEGKAILESLQLTAQRYLVYPANFWKHKNHEMLLTAFGMACDGDLPNDIKLVCTGAPGARQEWLMCAAQAMGLGARVLFPGYLPSAELASLMAHCSGVVFPSLYEGFGLPVIEAMAAGVPVACSNTTSLPEVAADAAILFDPRVPTQIARAMASLVADEPLRARLIAAGIDRCAAFSDVERMATEYWELFNYALDHQSPQTLLSGAHADGWAGPRLQVQIGPSTGKRTLELKLSAPLWLPDPRLTLQVHQNGNRQGDRLKFARGTDVELSLPISSKGGHFEISISPFFVPAKKGLGDDQRELSVYLRRCSIRANNSDCVELFPAKMPS